jgi:hypothetical protein
MPPAQWDQRITPERRATLNLRLRGDFDYEVRVAFQPFLQLDNSAPQFGESLVAGAVPLPAFYFDVCAQKA